MKLKQIRVDGYKNLINCVVNLGDFNVIVGPNNSGKSNLLEATELLGAFFFGSDDLVKHVLKGYTPPPRISFSACHLEKYRNKPITIGITFEIKKWVVNYDIKIRCGYPKSTGGSIVSEELTAKNPSKRGPARRYIRRRGRNLEVLGKTHKISWSKPSLQTIAALYPDFEGLPSEFNLFFWGIGWVGLTKIFTISPMHLRKDVDSEKQIEETKIGLISSWDLSLLADNIKEDGKHYELFRETLRDILDFEDVRFDAEDIVAPSGKETTTAKRMRYFILKTAGSKYSIIDEYSDGTLVVTAILEALFSEDKRGPILCLEELENCLHPAAVEKLLRFFQDHADQWPVLITTHSPYVLNGINPEDINVAVVDKTGAAHFEKVKNTKQLRDYLNKGLMSFGDLLVKDFAGFREG